MEQNNRPLPEGIRFFDRHANAPDFVLASVAITLDDFVNFARKNPQFLVDYQGKKQMKLQVLRSRDGKIYSAVDTYGTPAQPAKQQPAQQQAAGGWGAPQQQQAAGGWGAPQQQSVQQPSQDDLPF